MKQLKWKGLYLPFVKYGLMFLLVSPILYKLTLTATHISSINEWIKAFIYIVRFRTATLACDMLGPMWFLPVLFFVHGLCLLIDYALTRNNKSQQSWNLLVVYILLYYVGRLLFVNGIKEPYDFSRVMYLSFFYMLGYYSYSHLEVLNKWFYGIISLIVIFLGTSEADYIFNNPILYMLAAIMGIVMIGCFAQKISNTLVGKILIITGTNTMTIFIFHQLIMKIVQLGASFFFPINYEASWNGEINSEGYWWIYALFGLLIPILFIYTKGVIQGKSD